jgi:hypothetical protein
MIEYLLFYLLSNKIVYFEMIVALFAFFLIAHILVLYVTCGSYIFYINYTKYRHNLTYADYYHWCYHKYHHEGSRMYLFDVPFLFFYWFKCKQPIYLKTVLILLLAPSLIVYSFTVFAIRTLCYILFKNDVKLYSPKKCEAYGYVHRNVYFPAHLEVYDSDYQSKKDRYK